MINVKLKTAAYNKGFGFWETIMVMKILLTPIIIVKWILLVLLGALLGLLLSIGLEVAGGGKIVESFPILARLSSDVPLFLCGAFGGLFLGKLAFGINWKATEE